MTSQQISVKEAKVFTKRAVNTRYHLATFKEPLSASAMSQLSSHIIEAPAQPKAIEPPVVTDEKKDEPRRRINRGGNNSGPTPAVIMERQRKQKYNQDFDKRNVPVLVFEENNEEGEGEPLKYHGFKELTKGAEAETKVPRYAVLVYEVS